MALLPLVTSAAKPLQASPTSPSSSSPPLPFRRISILVLITFIWMALRAKPDLSAYLPTGDDFGIDVSELDWLLKDLDVQQEQEQKEHKRHQQLQLNNSSSWRQTLQNVTVRLNSTNSTTRTSATNLPSLPTTNVTINHTRAISPPPLHDHHGLPQYTNDSGTTATTTTTTTTPTVQVPPLNISIVVQLSGELGNHLSKVAFGYAIQQLLLERHNISSHLVLQHQEIGGSKWIHARRDLQRCFPFFRQFDFEMGNSVEFYNLQRRQQQQQREKSLLLDPNAFVFPSLVTMDEIDFKVQTIGQILTEKKNMTTTMLDGNVTTIGSSSNSSRNITFPFVHVQEFAEFPLLDRYYYQLRRLFEFDNDACCAALPDDDEAVFHFRNFVGEMPRRGKRKGYEELSPNQTVDELFGHLPIGSKIAMTSRIVDHPSTRNYTEAFERKGFQWRVISNQSGVEDFCFLKSAKRDLAGMVRSTFVRWAAILRGDDNDNDNGDDYSKGNSSTLKRTTWLYSIDSTDTRNALQDQALINYEWTFHPELKSQIKFVNFTAP